MFSPILLLLLAGKPEEGERSTDGSFSLLFLLCLLPITSLVWLPLYLPGLRQEEREKRLSRFHLFGTDTIHHSSLWDGRILFLTPSFNWCFVNFEETLLPWNIPVNSHDGGNVSHLLLASYNAFLSPWPSVATSSSQAWNLR